MLHDISRHSVGDDFKPKETDKITTGTCLSHVFLDTQRRRRLKKPTKVTDKIIDITGTSLLQVFLDTQRRRRLQSQGDGTDKHIRVCYSHQEAAMQAPVAVWLVLMKDESGSNQK